MPRAGWFAAGAAGGALAASSIGWRPLLLAGLAMLLGAAALWALRRSGDRDVGEARATGVPVDRRGATAVAAFALGAVLVAVRVGIGSLDPAPPSEIPSGRGPWSALVVTVGAPRDGAQVATLELAADGAPRVAATLPRYPEVSPGQVVEVAGGLRPPPDGEYGAWLRRTGVVATLRAVSLAPIAATDGPAATLETLRRESGRALALALPEPTAGLAAGILIGLRDEVDRDVAAAFTAAGVSHVVAISGWNIAIVAATIGALLRRSGRRPRSIAILLAIVAYTAFAGASPSVVRAAAMAGVVLLARESGRAGRAAAALGLAAGILLLVDPELVADAGFQLSVLATAGLLAWATPLRTHLERIARGHVPDWLLETLALSLAAQLATLPVVFATFGRLSLVAPAANLVVAPLVPLAMALGAVALAGGWAAVLGAPGAVAVLLGLPAWAVLVVLVGLVDNAASLPWATVELGPPWDTAAAIVAAAAVLALSPGGASRLRGLRGRSHQPATESERPPRDPPPDGRSGSAVASGRVATEGRAGRSRRAGTGGSAGRTRRVVAVLLAVAVAAVAIAAVHRSDGRIRLTVLDIGQGDAVLVEGDRGGRLLVDGGPDPDRLLVALDARLPPWDRRIDIVVLTHPHEDHVAGLPLLLDRYRVGRTFESGMPGSSPGYAAWSERVARRNPPAERLATGDRLTLDSIHLRVLWPDAGSVPHEPSDDGRLVNGSSIVLLGTIGSGRFLLTGDAEDDVDPVLVARGLPRVDVLKIAHHGSRTASSDAFLEAARPAIAVASVGTGNTYGHPAGPMIGRLERAGARFLRTDRDGAVEATFDGLAWSIRTERRVSATGRPLGYHRLDDRPEPDLGRADAPLPRPAALAPAPRASRRGDRGLARGTGRGARSWHRPGGRRGRCVAPRRGQAAPRVRSGRGPPARRRLGGMARASGPAGACGGGRRPPGDVSRRTGGRPMAAPGVARGAHRGLRRQTGRPATRVDGPALRGLGTPLSGEPGDARGDRGPTTCRPAGARPVWTVGDRPAGRPPPAMDGRRAAAGGERPGGERPGGRDVGGRDVIASGAVLAYLSGDDEYGIDRAVDRLAERLATGAGEPPQRHRLIGAATGLPELVELVGTAPMFGGGALVTLVGPGPLLGSKAAHAAIGSLLGQVAPGNGLAFVELVDGSQRGKRPASLAKLRDAVLAAGGEARDLKAPRLGELAGWIEARSRESGVQLERGAAQELARRVGGFVAEGDIDRSRMSMLAVGELAKLSLYRSGEVVRVEDVRALVPEAVPASSWAFVDAVGERRTAVAAELLPRILDTTPEPVLIAILHRRLRELISVSDLLAGGAAPGSLVRTLGLHEFRVRNLAQQAARWTPPELEAALDGVLELDARMKGVEGSTAAQRRLAVTLWVAEHVGGHPAGADPGFAPDRRA